MYDEHGRRIERGNGRKVDFLRRRYVGANIRINEMRGEPEYSGRTGTITSVDDMGQLHGTWGSLAVNTETDKFYIIP